MDSKAATTLERKRVLITHALYLVFTVLVNLDFYNVFLKEMESSEIILIFVLAAGISVQAIALGFAWKKKFSKYIDWSMVAFFVSTSAQYGLSVSQSFVAVNPYFNGYGSGQQGNQTIDKPSSCFMVVLDDWSYIKYLSPIVLLVITSACYPYPKSTKGFENSLAFGMGMIDSVDMMELLFGDLPCFQSYTHEWIIIFFLALGISMFLLTGTRGLERRTGEVKTRRDVATTLLNMIGNNCFMCFLRFVVIVKEKHISRAFIFVLLEVMVFIGRLIYVIYYYSKPQNKRLTSRI